MLRSSRRIPPPTRALSPPPWPEPWIRSPELKVRASSFRSGRVSTAFVLPESEILPTPRFLESKCHPHGDLDPPGLRPAAGPTGTWNEPPGTSGRAGPLSTTPPVEGSCPLRFVRTEVADEESEEEEWDDPGLAHHSSAILGDACLNLPVQGTNRSPHIPIGAIDAAPHAALPGKNLPPWIKMRLDQRRPSAILNLTDDQTHSAPDFVADGPTGPGAVDGIGTRSPDSRPSRRFPDIAGSRQIMEKQGFVAVEKPQNGLAGLKNWRHDLRAGLVVSLVSVPFSLGIAVASGAPPICGLISAIIAGLVLPFLGGSYVTISGPAAGLAPALLASMLLLGRGDLAIGYPLLLVAICLTGLVQVVLAHFRAARFSALFPSTVVEGMLASIGLLIIAKQLPLLVGHSFQAHEFWGIVAETPSQIATLEPKVFIIGITSLALIFVLASVKGRWTKILPPQVFAAVFGLLLGQFMGLDARFMIHIPDIPSSTAS